MTFLAQLAFSVLHGEKRHIECRGVAQRVHVAIAQKTWALLKVLGGPLYLKPT